MPFRRDNREFSETLFKNAKQQSSGSLGSELLKEILVDLKTGEMIPVKFESTSLQIDQYGVPTVHKEVANVLMDCGHRACSLEQVQGKCQYGHTICRDKCTLYTCEICGLKLCDLDVLMIDEVVPVCPEHDRDIMIDRVKIGLLRTAGDTVKFLCGWSGEQENDDY